MNRETLLVEFGRNLAFRFDQFPARLTAPLKDILGAFVVDQTDAPPLIISASGGSGCIKGSEARLITTRDGVRVYSEDPVIHFESPGIRAWCNTQTETAGLELIDAAPEDAQHFIAIALMSIIFELAVTRGWLGMHAAAVAVDGKAVLLPGDSGVGKSTLFRNAAAAGFDTLSADLVWLRETPQQFEISPLPRGTLDADAPKPSVDKAVLSAIVCPAIVDSHHNQLESIPLPDLLQTLVRQSGFLSPAQHAQRFTLLTRVASSAPSYRLAAGRDQQAVPALLRDLLV